jgi:hypothetical protein
MDAIRKRREYLIWEEQVTAEEERIQFLKQLKQETMKCNIVAQRITLQEYLVEKYDDIVKDIEEWTGDEEKIKTLDRATAEAMMSQWLEGFKLTQPSDFFKQNPTNDAELLCSIQ